MDSFDQKIIAALRQNARQSVSAIAEQVNLSRPAVSERMKRMEEQGEILGYQVLTSTKADESGPLRAYFEIKHGGYKCRPLVQLVMQYPEVKYCHGISGEVDLLVYIEFSEMQRLHEILAEIDNKLPQGAKIVTHMVLQTWEQSPG
ncbi:Lrp/AsnC family transcriptional regulator [Amphritea pacifica]|uniref:Lrp/AsnC family transcriptional regulator n=1 Tax=Amphritea pacifica TaxID=2811233 RepID=A0ABS2W6Z7_9GAMM|nr:Lrp/AsnC family transcriptional regulator [Amphritea pacifica]MBN0987343.1 Lrp/AsnC family transcriptional regulator [Amphritea pacifica]MBN1006097.1 Lrp/AsnC family transcriptional regulator [Amphritea pacifica]